MTGGPAAIELSLEQARRLAVTAQRLAGPTPAADLEGLKEVARDIRVVQIDPINVVAHTQLLVLRSRVGNFDRGLLDRLMWDERFLFHYFAHAASLVLTEDYPLFRYWMRRPFDPSESWGRRILEWMEVNSALRDHILRSLRRNGPLRRRDFEDRSVVPWRSSGWNEAMNISRMLEFLWAQGKIVIAGRAGHERLWELAPRWFPEWTPRRSMSERQVVGTAAQIALRCLGVGTPRHIREHFTRHLYPNLPHVLEALERRGAIRRVVVRGPEAALPGKWYIPRDRVDQIDALAGDDWGGRTTLLSPFDNLICDRARTEMLFDFHYRIEIYVPKDQRKFGYYALPILHGSRLIGRVDATVDRARDVLMVNAIHAEPGVPGGRDTGHAVAGAVQELADFVSSGHLGVRRAGIAKQWRPAFA